MSRYDGNINWVKVTVGHKDEVDRVHQALREGLDRSGLRPAIGDVIVVELSDQVLDDGMEDVERIFTEEFGSPPWIRVEAGFGSVRDIFGPRST